MKQIVIISNHDNLKLIKKSHQLLVLFKERFTVARTLITFIITILKLNCSKIIFSVSIEISDKSVIMSEENLTMKGAS